MDPVSLVDCAEGRTPLHWAAEGGQAESASVLLRVGGRVDEQGNGDNDIVA